MELVFARPRVSAYNFMRLLCASLVEKQKNIVDITNIVERIYDFKKTCDSDSLYLFEDIEFRKGVNNVVSNDISEGLANLQTFGVIGKLNPVYTKIMIYLTKYEAASILEEFDEDVREKMLELAGYF